MRSALSAAPRAIPVESGRVIWKSRSPSSSPAPRGPSNASCGTMVPVKARPPRSAERIPRVAARGSRTAERRASPSTSSHESPRGPGSASVRASTKASVARPAAPMGHFTPSRTQPARASRAVTSPARRSAPWPGSETARQGIAPSRSRSRMPARCGSLPAIQASWLHTPIPAESASAGLRRESVRASASGCSNESSSPPSERGTCIRATPSPASRSSASVGKRSASSCATAAAQENGPSAQASPSWASSPEPSVACVGFCHVAPLETPCIQVASTGIRRRQAGRHHGVFRAAHRRHRRRRQWCAAWGRRCPPRARPGRDAYIGNGLGAN